MTPPENPAKTACDIRNHWKAASTMLSLISSLYCDLPTGDRTSDDRMPSRNSNTELLVHIAQKRSQINYNIIILLQT